VGIYFLHINKEARRDLLFPTCRSGS